ncbi:MAG: c-type cytochrome [Elusimicrobia bacterium]|nr:c-type cytochrome [Elusimicrobiota bacterium]
MKRMRHLFVLIAAAVPALAAQQNLVSNKTDKLGLDPYASAWEKAAAVKVAVAPQKLVVPQGGGAISSVEVQSLRTASEIFFRLRWADPSKSEDLELSGQFVDGVALEFPLAAGSMPAPMMGEKGNPVNVWRWSAAMAKPEHYAKAYSDYYRPDAIHNTIKYSVRPEDLVAEGWGTIGRRREQAVDGAGDWKDGTWTVVLRRKLRAPGGAAFAGGSVIPFALAVWEGGSQERGPAKSFSVWNNLLLDHGIPAKPKNPLIAGKIVYQRYGCGACHGADAKGGVPNPGSQTDPIPALNRVAEGFTEDEIKKVILNGRNAAPADPNGIAPRLHMNSWKALMDEEEVHALIDYLFSLMPKEKGQEW